MQNCIRSAVLLIVIWASVAEDSKSSHSEPSHNEDHSGGGHESEDHGGTGHKEDHSGGGHESEDHSVTDHKEDHSGGGHESEDHGGTGHKEDHSGGGHESEDHGGTDHKSEDHSEGHESDEAHGGHDDHSSEDHHSEDHTSEKHKSGHSDWDYLLPQSWGHKYPACGGRQQSPVNVDTSKIAHRGNDTLHPHYHPLGARAVKNTGHGLQVDGNFGHIAVHGVTYNALHLQLHFPSEHAIDGHLHEGELHIVHQEEGATGTDGLLIISLLLDLGHENHLLSRLGLPEGAPEDGHPAMYVRGSIDLAHEMHTELSGPFYSYDGSLTSPPCSETVKWFVLEKTQTVSQAQVLAFKTLYPSPANNRPIQLLGGRVIEKNSFLGCSGGSSGGDSGHRRLSSSWDHVLPQCWASHYPDCNGLSQSPVDIDTKLLRSTQKGNESLSSLFVSFPVSVESVTNTGHWLKVDGDFGTVTLPGETYKAVGFNILCPSEHSIDGILAACELQIVHRKEGSSGTNDLLVISILFNLGGGENLFLKALGLGASPTLPMTVDLGFTFSSALMGSFYHYDGSLTTPPCSETVKWFVVAEGQTISQAQVDAYNALFQGPTSIRPVQLLHGRPIVKGITTTRGQPLSRATGCPKKPGDGGHADWMYTYPQCWAASYPACGGRAQSPVNIHTHGSFAAEGAAVVSKSVHYEKLENLKVVNDGHGLKVSGKFGYIMVDGHKYEASQLDIHCPSEHTLDSKVHACEVQIMHQREGSKGRDDLLIVGVMFQVGAKNILVQNMLDSNADENIAFSVDLEGEFGKLMRSGFYMYDGSLTTPPCSETVQWFILRASKTLAQPQVDAIKALLQNQKNNRPIQLLNGRGMFHSAFPGCQIEESGAYSEWQYVLPQCWASHFPHCGGTMQSPINIDTTHLGSVVKKHTLEVLYDPADMTVLNNGHTLKVAYKGGSITFAGHKYEAVQIDFHFPSEHAINGKLAVGELHITHRLKDEKHSGGEGDHHEGEGKHRRRLETAEHHGGEDKHHDAEGDNSTEHHDGEGEGEHSAGEGEHSTEHHDGEGEHHDAEGNHSAGEGEHHDGDSEHHDGDGKHDGGEGDHSAGEGEHVDEVVVVSIMFELGAENEFLKSLGLPGNSSALQDVGATHAAGAVDLSAALSFALEGSFFTYGGSLTTPPCSEDVRWVVMETPLTASQDQVNAAKALFGNPANNRPLQLLNGRKVHKNTETMDRTMHHSDDHGHSGTHTAKYKLVGSGACDSWPWLGILNGATEEDCKDYCTQNSNCVAYTSYTGGDKSLSPGTKNEISCNLGCILYDKCETTKPSSCDGTIVAYKKEPHSAQVSSANGLRFLFAILWIVMLAP